MDRWEDWQKPYQFGTIVIWPPDEIREIVNTQRNVYDPVSQSYCEAHITFTQPLTKSLSDDEWEQILKLLKNYDCFELEYGPLNSFLPYPCIWYEIEPKVRVLDIRNALHQTGFFNLNLSHTKDFIPHMTITEGLSGPAVDEGLLELLQGESRSGSFLCTEIAYIFPNDQFCFNVMKTLPLKTEGS
nr:putative integron gene cassette protein [uncultured bacterium]